ncbi:hypothetical protein E2C01_072699 [Portunus trituberculatus]|uniref:Uncharacterized protein n=1 Tax=Portunus trituberculatus TaxID=210409 RepID=A0A5B7I9M2_PORTR|nr:hypothetical protein [Portunus trituberculatus]
MTCREHSYIRAFLSPDKPIRLVRTGCHARALPALGAWVQRQRGRGGVEAGCWRGWREWRRSAGGVWRGMGRDRKVHVVLSTTFCRETFTSTHHSPPRADTHKQEWRPVLAFPKTRESLELEPT